MIDSSFIVYIVVFIITMLNYYNWFLRCRLLTMG